MQLLVMKLFIIMIQAKIVLRHTWRHHLHLGANANGDGDNDGDDIDDDSEDDDDDGTDNDDKDDFAEVFHPCPPPVWTCHSTRTRQKKTKERERADQTCLNNLPSRSPPPLNFLLNKPVSGDLSQLLTDGG